MGTTITKITKSGQTTVPATIRRAFNLSEGDMIEWILTTVKDSLVVLVSPKKTHDAADEIYWSKQHQILINKALAEVEAGRTASFDSVEELIASLRS